MSEELQGSSCAFGSQMSSNGQRSASKPSFVASCSSFGPKVTLLLFVVKTVWDLRGKLSNSSITDQMVRASTSKTSLEAKQFNA